ELKLNAKKVELRAAEAKLKREEQLVKNGVISADEIDLATVNVAKLQAEMAQVQREADQLKREISQGRSGQKVAAGAPSMVLSGAVDESEVKVAELKINVKKAELEAAKSRLNRQAKQYEAGVGSG